jgi:Amt family ammonium transporter
MHPLGALLTGGIAGGLFVWMFILTQNRWKIDDVLGVWPLHGLCGAWGGLAAGIFGLKALGGLGGTIVNGVEVKIGFMSQLIGTSMGVAIAFVGGFAVYFVVNKIVGIRLSAEEEFNGADLSIHKITATPERESGW